MDDQRLAHIRPPTPRQAIHPTRNLRVAATSQLKRNLDLPQHRHTLRQLSIRRLDKRGSRSRRQTIERQAQIPGDLHRQPQDLAPELGRERIKQDP